MSRPTKKRVKIGSKKIGSKKRSERPGRSCQNKRYPGSIEASLRRGWPAWPMRNL